MFLQIKDLNISNGIFGLTLGLCARGGTLNRSVQGAFFFKHGPVPYQIDGDDKTNMMQIFTLASNL